MDGFPDSQWMGSKSKTQMKVVEATELGTSELHFSHPVSFYFSHILSSIGENGFLLVGATHGRSLRVKVSTLSHVAGKDFALLHWRMEKSLAS